MNNPVMQLTPETAQGGDTVRIFLRDCKVALRVGIYAKEMQAPQLVIINVEAEAVLRYHYHDLAEKNLDRVINYAPLHHFISVELPKLGHIPLLETVAEQIIAFCFRDPRIYTVRVRLEKPEILDNTSAGIEILRLRPNEK